MHSRRFSLIKLRAKSLSSRQKVSIITIKLLQALFSIILVWFYYDSYTRYINAFKDKEGNKPISLRDHDNTSKNMNKYNALNELKEVASESESYSKPKVVEVIKGNLLQEIKYRDPDVLWPELIKEIKSKKNPGIVMEIGMYDLSQCLAAAQAGLQAYCVEASPKNFQKIRNELKNADSKVQDRIHLYNFAAGDTSEGTVPFLSLGGTGDHISSANMWSMDAEPKVAEGKTTEVPSKKVDDLIAELSVDVIIEVLKIDTQGYEPRVLAGLKKTLPQHRINYILIEFWPRGMDLLAGKKDACIATGVLKELTKYGYTLYSLLIDAHPRAPKGYRAKINTRPMDSFEGYCRWYFEVEEKLQKKDPDYKMGYWSNILAVAPSIMNNAPISPLGQKLLEK